MALIGDPIYQKDSKGFRDQPSGLGLGLGEAY